MSRPKAPPAPPASADEIELQFYEALRLGDLERLMALWSDEDDISCVHPGGPRLAGAAAIRASFESMFGRGPIHAYREKVRRLQSHSCAVHSVLERVEVPMPGGREPAWVVATNVYLKSAQGWRLVAHHASPAAPGVAPDSAESAATLH